MIRNGCLWGLAPILLGLGSCSSMPGEDLYVAVEGKAGNRGGREAPLSFRAAIRRASELLKEEGLPQGGLRIHVQTGEYPFEAPFVLGAEFRGSEEAPIVIQAEGPGRVRFDSSAVIPIAGFRRVVDPTRRVRLAGKAVDKIVVTRIDNPALIARLEQKLIQGLVIDGKAWLPSVFPNEGYATLGSETVSPEISPPAIPPKVRAYGIRAGHPPYQVPGKPPGWKGSLEDPRGARVGIAGRREEMAGTFAQWERELARNNRRNALVGFIEANWLLSSQPIVSASARQSCIHLSRALGYGWSWRKRDKPFRVFGLLCELDRPGEWHYDPMEKLLYLYPPKDLAEIHSIELPVAQGFLRLEGARHVKVVGLDVTHVAGGSVYRIGGEHNLIASCRITSCTATGVEVLGRHNSVRGCDLIDLDRHVILRGGVRSPSRLQAGHNLVQNCHILQKEFRHQRVGISMSGVGNRFCNNLVHNSLGQAMTVQGNDLIVEKNEFFNIGFDEGDGGAVYSGADMAGYGNTYRYNFFHHLMHVSGKVERSGIHLDDYQAGATCIGNVFYKSAGKGIFMNGGAGHTLVDNVFLECYRGIYNVGHGAKRAWLEQRAIQADPGHIHRNTKENYIGRIERVVGKEGWKHDPWRSRYPLFSKVMEDKGEFGRFWPIRCVVRNNFYYKTARGDHTIWSRVAREAMRKVEITQDRKIGEDAFVDYASMDFRFAPNRKDLPHIPFDAIGLVQNEYRRVVPDKRKYRKAIRDYFDGIPCMPGTRKRIDSSQLFAPAGPGGADGPGRQR